MNPFNPFDVMAAALRSVSNRHEAGLRWSSRRSTLPGHVQDARFDADAATREELVRKSRYFDKNNAFFGRLKELFITYTCGADGLKPIPASSSEDWNKKAMEFWRESEPFINLNSQQGFADLQTTVAGSWFVDGECFAQKTRGARRGSAKAFPRIQIFESHRCATPTFQNVGKGIHDGIEYDESGRKLRYWIREGMGDPFGGRDSVEFRPVDASHVIHVFEPMRPMQLRGIPRCSSVINDLHDLDDLQILEMDAAKEAAVVEKFIETASGELPGSNAYLKAFTASGDEGTSSGSSHSRVKYYDEQFKGKIKALLRGDKVQQYVSNRPSVAVRDYWEHIITKICVGVGISKLLAFPSSMQGTVARGSYEADAAFFRSRSRVMQYFVREVYLYFMDWGRYHEPRLFDAPGDWDRVIIRPPKAPNVDAGRNSQAMISEYEAGLTTLERIFTPQGEDWREVIEQRVKEDQYLKSVAEFYGVDSDKLAEEAVKTVTEDEDKTKQQAVPGS